MVRPLPLIVISASSGVGKTSLVNALCKRNGYRRIITYTTRTPRSGEIAGKDYHFIDHANFIERIRIGFFAEWSDSYGALYGTAREDLENGDQIKLAIVDCSGMTALKRHYPGAFAVWIVADFVEQKRRLIGRGDMSDQEITRRASIARQEAAFAESESVDYILKNDHFDRALDELEMMVSHYLQKFLWNMREKELTADHPGV